MKALLQSGKSLAQYQLMERISPPTVEAIMFRDGKVSEMNAVSELGFFGILIPEEYDGLGGGSFDV